MVDEGLYPLCPVGVGRYLDLTVKEPPDEEPCSGTCIEVEAGDVPAPAPGAARFTFEVGAGYQIILFTLEGATYAVIAEDLDPLHLPTFLRLAEPVIRSFQFP